jgi:hypothetical protein
VLNNSSAGGLSPPLWLLKALDGVRRLHGSLEPPLAARLERILSRSSQMNGGSSLSGALCSASAPFVRLVDAYRQDVGIDLQDARLHAIGEGAVLLYVHLRAEDDLVDEPAASDRGDVFLMEVLSAASVRAFATAVSPQEDFFRFRETVMLSFANVAAWEIDVAWRGGAGAPGEAMDVAPAWLGRKFLPAAVPLGALAFLAGRGADAARLADLVVDLGCGLQVINDVLNAGEDHAGGRPTPVLHSLYVRGRAARSDAGGHVRAVLLSDEALDRALERARETLGRAESAALSMGAGALASTVRDRIDFVDTVPARLLALSLGGGVL